MTLTTSGKMHQLMWQNLWLIAKIPCRVLVEYQGGRGQVFANFIRSRMIVRTQPFERAVSLLSIDGIGATAKRGFIPASIKLVCNPSSPSYQTSRCRPCIKPNHQSLHLPVSLVYMLRARPIRYRCREPFRYRFAEYTGICVSLANLADHALKPLSWLVSISDIGDKFLTSRNNFEFPLGKPALGLSMIAQAELA